MPVAFSKSKLYHGISIVTRGIKALFNNVHQKKPAPKNQYVHAIMSIFFLHRTRTTTPNPRNRTDMQKSIRNHTQTPTGKCNQTPHRHFDCTWTHQIIQPAHWAMVYLRFEYSGMDSLEISYIQFIVRRGR